MYFMLKDSALKKADFFTEKTQKLLNFILFCAALYVAVFPHIL